MILFLSYSLILTCDTTISTSNTKKSDSSDVSVPASVAPVPHSSTNDTSEQTNVTQRPSSTSPFSSTRTGSPRFGRSNDSSTVPTDLWSAAFREAVDTLHPRIDVAHLAGKTTVKLLQDLETVDRSINAESTFRRGLAHLRSAKGPLDNFKLALDLASPLISFEPTAATVVGVVRGVTTVRRYHKIALHFDEQLL